MNEVHATLMQLILLSCTIRTQAMERVPWCCESLMNDITVIDPAALLGDLNEIERKYAPKQLYVRGDIDYFLSGPRVSIVGSRTASSAGLLRASRLARELITRANTVIVSGLAKGIDAAAHKSAIDNKGRTIAVIGTPLDKSYPAENRELQSFIARKHLLISQFPIGTYTGKQSFPMRNRTMALLSDATVIIEAGESSGTVSQAWEALRLGRPLFLAKSFVDTSDYQWIKDVMTYGAEVLDDDNLDLFIDSLPSRESVYDTGIPIGA